MTRRLPALTPQTVIQALERAGFVVRRVKGSHYHLTHPRGARVSVPYHTKDLKRSTLHSIIKQAGFTVDDFLDLL